MVEWTYTLSFRSSFSVFSGLAVAGLVDRVVMRDQESLPYVPGSSVKGRWRYFAERLLEALRKKGMPEGLGFHRKKEPLCKDPHNACTICKLFGNSSLPAIVWVGQAELVDSQKNLFRRLLERNRNPVVHPDAELRPGIAISRKTRTPMPDHLFFDEAIPAATLTGKLMIRGPISGIEEMFLKNSGKLVDGIGGRKAVGRGILVEGIKIIGGAP